MFATAAALALALSAIPPGAADELSEISIAGLETLYAPNRCPRQTDRTIVVLHGYGTSERRLRRLARSYTRTHCARLLFPHGPVQVSRGRSWWRAPKKGWRPNAVGWNRVAAGMEQASDKLEHFLDTLRLRYQVPRDALILAGFSQGATLATELTLNRGVDVAGLLLCSGRFGANPAWKEGAESIRGTPMVITHGKLDRIAPFWGAAELRGLLEARGARVEFLPYDGGHHPGRSAGRNLHRALRRLNTAIRGAPPSALRQSVSTSRRPG